MNVYDALHSLTDAIKISSEFLRYKKAAETVEADEQSKNAVKAFMSLQLEMTTLKMFGQQPTEEQIEKFNAQYSSLAKTPAAEEFIQAQMYFSRMMDDIARELSVATEIDVEFLKFQQQ